MMRAVREIQMSMTPYNRVRQQVASRLVPQIAELILRADKGSPYMRLADLRTEASRAVYIDAALQLLVDARRAARIQRVHQADAHQFAIADREEQDVILLARSDIAKFGASTSGSIRAGHCWVCHERLTPADAFVLELSATLKADVHGTCCTDDPRFELVSAFSFRLIGGAR